MPSRVVHDAIVTRDRTARALAGRPATATAYKAFAIMKSLAASVCIYPPRSRSAHGGAGLGERPAVALEVVGGVEGQPPRAGQLGDDRRPGRPGPPVVRVDVVDVDPGRVDRRPGR